MIIEHVSSEGILVRFTDAELSVLCNSLSNVLYYCSPDELSRQVCKKKQRIRRLSKQFQAINTKLKRHSGEGSETFCRTDIGDSTELPYCEDPLETTRDLWAKEIFPDRIIVRLFLVAMRILRQSVALAPDKLSFIDLLAIYGVMPNDILNLYLDLRNALKSSKDLLKRNATGTDTDLNQESR